MDLQTFCGEIEIPEVGRILDLMDDSQHSGYDNTFRFFFGVSKSYHKIRQ